MKVKDYFTLEESPYAPGKYVVDIHHDLLGLTTTKGSYNILMARLMNLSYAQYLRFCRDCLGGELVGKGHLYPTVYLPNNMTTHAFIHLLNMRAYTLLWEREHPDWKEHTEFVSAHQKELEECRNVSKTRRS